jgi:hypothetical protein
MTGRAMLRTFGLAALLTAMLCHTQAGLAGVDAPEAPAGGPVTPPGKVAALPPPLARYVLTLKKAFGSEPQAGEEVGR